MQACISSLGVSQSFARRILNWQRLKMLEWVVLPTPLFFEPLINYLKFKENLDRFEQGCLFNFIPKENEMNRMKLTPSQKQPLLSDGWHLCSCVHVNSELRNSTLPLPHCATLKENLCSSVSQVNAVTALCPPGNQLLREDHRIPHICVRSVHCELPHMPDWVITPFKMWSTFLWSRQQLCAAF